MLEAFGSPLRVVDRPDPPALPGHVIVEVRAVGLCGTDLKIISGAYPGTPLPLVPGHEVAGVVVEGTAEHPVGSRVAAYVYDPCGACRWCIAAQDTLCPNSRRIGFDLDGGLATRVRLRARNALPFGPGLDFAPAAVAMDAVTTVWRAVRVRGAVAAGETVVVAGAGGLGLNAVQVARAAGARVAMMDPLPERRLAAIELGAEVAVRPESVAELVEWAEGGADLGLEASGTRAGFEAAAGALRPGARLVCVGYRPGVEYGCDSHHIVRTELTILGSRNGAREDARAALSAVESGAVVPLIAQRLPLAEVNQGLSALRAGDAAGRIVVEPAS